MKTLGIFRIFLIIIWGIQNVVIVSGDMNEKIVGGTFANINDFPHMVYISTNCQGVSSCGANIVNQKLLLTAAHCVEICNLKRKKDYIDAFAGSANLNNMKVVRRIEKFKIHEKYNPQTVPFDIALLWADKPFPLGKKTKRVIITRSFPETVAGNTAGWGYVDDYNTETQRLKSIDQIVKNKQYCAQKGRIIAGTMCATSSNLRNYLAGGDSGSGLIYDSQIIGIVACRYKKNYETTFYTNISYFYNWIVATARKLACPK